MTVRPVEGDIAGLRRVGDERPLRRLHLGESAPSSAQAPPSKRIIAASIEDQEVESRPSPLHLAQHEVDIEQLEIDLGFSGRIGAHRHQIVGPPHLEPVPGVIEEGNPRALDDLAELLHHTVEARLVEVEVGLAPYQGEAQGRERLANKPRVVCWIVKPRYILILAIANHECHPAAR
jgi:hypothetical protein